MLKVSLRVLFLLEVLLRVLLVCLFCLADLVVRKEGGGKGLDEGNLWGFGGGWCGCEWRVVGLLVSCIVLNKGMIIALFFEIILGSCSQSLLRSF